MRMRAAVTALLLAAAALAGRGPQARTDGRPADLQKLVDDTAAGGTLLPPAGIYAGPIVINKPITLDGSNGVTIDAGGHGTVVLLQTDGATLRNLHLTHSGDSYNDVDAAVQVRGRYNVVKDNRIDDTLFGIDLQQSDSNIIRRNHISSKNVELGQRGDAIRLWYSNENTVTENEITHSRDTVVWYSKDNRITHNRATGGRYALHFMYAQKNHVEDNYYADNSVGVFLMYSDGVELRNNTILHATGATGIGIGMKETSQVVVENNKIISCAVGLYLDVSPYQPDTTNLFRDNVVAYSGIGVQFHSDWTGNVFHGNHFVSNLTQVAVSGARTAKRNDWDGNFWDDYEGFDRNGDGIGDTPHDLYSYADRIWQDVPSTQFFKGAPVLEVLDFLERLAPFSPAELVLRDPHPKLQGKEVHS